MRGEGGAGPHLGAAYWCGAISLFGRPHGGATRSSIRSFAAQAISLRSIRRANRRVVVTPQAEPLLQWFYGSKTAESCSGKKGMLEFSGEVQEVKVLCILR